MDATLRFLRMAFTKTQIAGMQLSNKYPGLADIAPLTTKNAAGEEVLLHAREPSVGFSSPEGRLLQPLLEVQVVPVVRVRVRGTVVAETALADANETWLDETIAETIKRL